MTEEEAVTHYSLLLLRKKPHNTAKKKSEWIKTPAQGTGLPEKAGAKPNAAGEPTAN